MNFLFKLKHFLLFKLQVLITKILLYNKLQYLGKNVIISRKLFMGKNLENVKIYDNVRIRYGIRIETFPEYSINNRPRLIINSGTKIETFLHIGCVNKVIIGKNVLIASNVFITDHNHNFTDRNKPILKQGIYSKGAVFIGDNTWIGNNVVILPNVKIGKNCVIGANSVVNKNIPDYSIAAGVPCKIIKKIS